MKTKKELQKLSLNYLETAFIMGLKGSECKVIYEKIIGEKFNSKTEISVSDLMPKFKVVRSVDNRYDGENSLLFNLMYKSENYKKFLNLKSVIDKKKFTGGKSIFHKIMNERQEEHFLMVVKSKKQFLNITKTKRNETTSN